MASGSSFTNVFGGSSVRPSQPSYLALVMAANTPLVWPLETTESEPSVASQIDVTPTLPGLKLMMPPGNTGSTGVASMISNIGVNIFTVTDQAGNLICSIQPTQSWLISLTDNSTANGTWRALQMASTVSSAVAGALAGPGLQAIGSQLQTTWKTRSLNVDTLITSAFRSTLIVWRGGVGALQLDTIANLTADWFCAISNQGTGLLTVSAAGGATINSQATLPMEPGNSGIFVCSAVDFNSIGALSGPLSIENGGTGADTADGALTNLGGTSLGLSIFAAANAQAVIALLGLQNLPITEQTVSSNQDLSSSSGGTIYVATAAITITLPLTTTTTTNFLTGVYAQNGNVTVTPQATDAINGQAAAATYTVSSGQSALFITDAAGNWWPICVSSNLTILNYASALGISPPVSIGPTIIYIDTTSTGSSVILPATGGPYTVKDSTGHANSNNIDVYWVGTGPTIDGSGFQIINTAYGHITIAQNGANGAVIG